MSQLTLAQAEKIPQGNSSFFSLKDDKDVAQVRFLYDSIDEVFANAVHKIKVGDSFHTVGCLRAQMDQPLSTCPLCASNNRMQPRIYIQLLNTETNQVQVWERSYSWFDKTIKPLFRRYPNLVSVPFEIERNGVAGDMKTTYTLFPLQADDSTVESLDVERINLAEEGIIKELDYQEQMDLIDGQGLPERYNNNSADIASPNTSATSGDGSRRRTQRSF